MEALDKLCISLVEPIFTVKSDLNLIDSISKLYLISEQMDLPFVQIIASTEYEPNQTRIMFTGHKDWINSYFEQLNKESFSSVNPIQYGIYISGFGLTSSAYEQTLFNQFKKNNLNFSKCIRDSKGILFVGNEAEKNKAIQFLNQEN